MRFAATGALLMVAGIVTGCVAEGPEERWDYETYPGQDPVAFSPIPGGDLEVWQESIDSLDLGDWSRTGEEYRPGFNDYVPREDERVEADRLVWELRGGLDGEAGLARVTAQAVTDESGALLFVFCEVEDHRDFEGPIAPGARDALTACAAGAANDAMGSTDLTDWTESILTGFESRSDEETRQTAVETMRSGPVQAFLTDDGSTTAVTVSVDHDAAGAES